MILVLAYSDITPFSEKCSPKTLTFKKAYDNYLQSDIVDSIIAFEDMGDDEDEEEL